MCANLVAVSKTRHLPNFAQGVYAPHPKTGSWARNLQLRLTQLRVGAVDLHSKFRIGKGLEDGCLNGGIALSELTVARFAAEVHTETDSLYRASFELSGAGSAQVDPHTGRFLLVNQAMCQITGYSREELLVRTFSDITHPEDRAKDYEGYQALLRGEVRELIAEKRYLRKDGSSIWVLINIAMLKDEAGAPLRSLGVIHDISARKQSEQALRDSEDRFRRSIEEATTPIMLRTDDGIIHTVNRCWTELSGYSKEDITTLDDWCSLAYGARKDEVLEFIKENNLAKRKIESYEAEVTTADGKTRYWRMSATPLGRFTDGQNITMVMAVDFTESRLKEQELQFAKEIAEKASRAKTAFLANMSHEIRTPLNAVIGFTSLLGNADLDAESRALYSEAVARNGRQLLQIIDDILDISKVESGKLEVEKLPVSLHELARDAIAMLGIRAQQKRIQIHVTHAHNLPKQVISDPMRVRQILLNILGNAVKFSPADRKVFLAFGIAPQHRRCNGPVLTIDVRDRGPGIDKAAARRLFEPFSQADMSTTRRFGGTGLGLALSRRLAQALGGELELTWSEVGVGSSFRLTLPLEVSPADGCDLGDLSPAQENVPMSLTTTGGLPLLGLSVLVVDDAPDNRLLVSNLLSLQGARVDTADDGEQAIDAALRTPYDVVLMDIQMPNLDGLAATRKLRELGFSQPILALTAHAFAEERREILASGCNAHLSKPVEIAELVQTVASYAVRPTQTTTSEISSRGIL